MKITFVGGGFISEKLRRSVEPSHTVNCISLRNLPAGTYTCKSELAKCSESELIVYLAYDHRDFLKNILTLKRLLTSLKNSNWNGKFIFFNTQSAIANVILRNPKYTKAFLGYEQYAVTKQIQSWLLSRFSQMINISELYLPVVTGVGSSAEDWCMNMARNNCVNLPSQGKNITAYLDVDKFSKWFWGSYFDELYFSKQPSALRKIFIYEDVCTFGELLMSARSKISVLNSSTEFCLQSLIIGNCNYKYRFSDSLMKNLIFILKVSPLWFTLNILRGRYYAFFRRDKEAMRQTTDASFTSSTFKPIGLEYQYLCSSIEIASIPFRIEKA